MADIKLKLGARIRDLRKARNLTQDKLVEMIGSDTNNLSRIENGKKFLSAEKLDKIAQALNVEVKDLFDFEHEKPEKELMSEIIEILKSHPERTKDFYNIIKALTK